MGIPTYFSFIARKYPEIVETQLGDVDCLYFDYNCLIYHVYNRLISEKYHDLINVEKDKFEKMLIDEVVKYTKYITDQVVKPNSLIYIALDGVVPMAKMHQQRLRRFKSHKMKAYENEFKMRFDVYKEQIWDTNAITPGTVFMDKLCKRLEKEINDNTMTKLHEIHYFLSTVYHPGEGEQKMVNHVKENFKSPEFKDLRFCFYGLDADVVILSLSLNKNIVLLRENQDYAVADAGEGNEFVQVEIPQLADGIYTELEIDGYNQQRIIDDYVFLSFLLGNDFVHRIPSLQIINGGIDFVSKIYLRILKASKNRYLVDKGVICHSFLLRLFEELAKSEDHNLKYLQEKKRIPNIPTRLENEYDIEKYKFDRVPLNEDYRDQYDIIDYTDPDYKDTYYMEYFGTLKKDYLNKICKTYLQGLTFTANYYFKEVPSWEWHYPFPVSPFVSDIYAYLKSNVTDINYIGMQKGSPVGPIEQLMLVLPPKNSDLIPKEYNQLMFEELREFYPVDFKIDAREKMMLYMAEPILPHIDKKWMLEEIRKKKLSKTDDKRNQLIKKVIYEVVNT